MWAIPLGSQPVRSADITRKGGNRPRPGEPGRPTSRRSKGLGSATEERGRDRRTSPMDAALSPPRRVRTRSLVSSNVRFPNTRAGGLGRSKDVVSLSTRCGISDPPRPPSDCSMRSGEPRARHGTWQKTGWSAALLARPVADRVSQRLERQPGAPATRRPGDVRCHERADRRGRGWVLWSCVSRSDEVGMRFATALEAAAARGVNVRVIVDGVGARGIERAFLRDTRRKGVDLRVFDPAGIPAMDGVGPTRPPQADGGGRFGGGDRGESGSDASGSRGCSGRAGRDGATRRSASRGLQRSTWPERWTRCGDG